MTISHTIRQAAPDIQTAPALSRLLGRTARGLATALKRMQYGQMVAALNRLSDQDRAPLGVRRGELAVHAHRLIYGPD
jgi:hypothetical protein